jgi:membrane protein implicated in regulation of membrane protease activity
MPAPLWLLLALPLLGLALLGIDSDGLLLLGGGVALLLAALTALVPLTSGVQILLGLALLGAGAAGLRRWASRSREQAIPPAARASSAEVIAAFDAAGEGRVLWQGQSWAALNLEPGRALPAGERVNVLGREGTRLQVLPEADSHP